MTDLVAPLMIPALLALTLAGAPVAYALLVAAAAGSAVIFGDNLFQLLHRTVETSASAYALTAAPPFLLMAAILRRAFPGATFPAAPSLAAAVVYASVAGLGAPATAAGLIGPVAILAALHSWRNPPRGPTPLAPALLIVAVLVLMLGRLVSPAEAGALGALAAAGLAFAFGPGPRLSTLAEAALDTATLLLTLCAGLFFAGVFIAAGGGTMVADLAGGTRGLVVLGLVAVALVSLAVGPVAAMLVCAPILAPLVRGGGADPVWFAALFLLAAQAGALIDPRAPRASLLPAAAQIAVIAAAALLPALVTWAPDLLGRR